MKNIGREVLFLKTGEGNPRNGEGTFIRLKSKDIMHVYTEYYGDSWVDHATARISACISHDEGENWDAPFILLEKDEKAENYMSPSLLRLSDGGIGMIFLRKENECNSSKPCTDDDWMEISCMPMFCRSDDEGKTWSQPIVCGVPRGYYCAINDGVIMQKNGRILMPMSSHEEGRAATVIIAYSDDNGKTWGMLDHEFKTIFSDNIIGLAEPGIYEFENGELWMWCRTLYGHQYESRSYDGGKTWTPVEPNFYFTSPDSPMRVKKFGKYTVAFFNPVPCLCTRSDYRSRGSIMRTPLVCAVSDDDGHSFDTFGKYVGGKEMIAFTKRSFYLEDDPASTYCYPSAIEVEGGFLVAYYHSNGGDYTLNCTKITKVAFDEIAADRTANN